MKRLPAAILAGLLVPGLAPAQQMDAVMDGFSQQLRYSSPDGELHARLSGTLDLEAYAFEGEPPGLLRSDDDWLLQPRATLFLDVQSGSKLYGFAQLRLDRGFDPADRPADLRLDEYALRFTPWEDGRFSVQAGQFATVVGRWVVRHLSWQNPFITAPLLYENPTRLSDLRRIPSPSYLVYPSGRDTYAYNPVIWGPSYATGVALSGKRNPFEWAIELKNTSLMSRPEFWPVADTGFDAPTLSGRFAWRPDLRWTVGISASEGAYAGPEGDFHDRDNFRQQLVMIDVSYEYRHLQIWSEWAWSSFTVPSLGEELQVWAWFIESRYKLAPRLSVAVRWNEQRYSEIHYYGQYSGQWGEDLRRLDFALTWRFNAHAQMQVEIDHYWPQGEGKNRFVMASRITLRF